MKRIFDIIMSFVALMIFSLPILIIAILLRVIEKHPILFKQERIGKNKIPFQIFKFQTMVNEVVTNTGRILRKTGLDEVPQFINVLKGDMSIVGPRAITMMDIKRLNWNGEYYKNRWEIKPGITGYAQLYGGQNKKTSWFWDKYYINKSTLFVDLIIIALSFLMNLFGKTKIRRLIFKKKNLM